MKESRFFAVFGVLTTCIVAVILISLSAQIQPLPEERRQHTVLQLSSIASGAALIGFSFGGNAVVRPFFFSLSQGRSSQEVYKQFPQIESAMQQPKRFTAALSVATLLAVAFYLPVAIAGYMVFGVTVEDMFSSLQSVYTREEHPVQLGALIASMLLLLGHLLMTFPIIFSALSIQIDSQLPAVSKQSSRSKKYARELLRPALWGLVTIMAVLVPHFMELLTVVSAVTNTLIVTVCPVVLYLVLKRQRGLSVPVWEYALCFIILIVGCGIGGVATKEGIEALHKAMQN